jgi:sialate O-acetylesterase
LENKLTDTVLFYETKTTCINRNVAGKATVVKRGKMRVSFCLSLVIAFWTCQLALAAQGGLKRQPSIVGEVQDGDSTPVPPLLNIAANDVKRNFVSATLGSNMVLQRDKEVTIWGYSQKGSIITTGLYYDGDENGNDTNARLVLATTVEGDDGLWRQNLPSQPASLDALAIKIKSSTGEEQTLHNILFGDVYICGGQSNMQFSIPGTTNGTAEAERANKYPHIRVFTVGDRTSSDTPLPDLQTVLQDWNVASNQSLFGANNDFFLGYFSSVCWFFGRGIADSLDNTVPIGLISNNWGGTAIEKWQPNGPLYNAMIYPYMVGPMALTGFTWYQGEANVFDQNSATAYSHSFPDMINAWRKGFQAPDAYFGFIQLSTWCPAGPLGLAEMRQAQMAALNLPKVGYATNADWGDGCNIHPPTKQYCGARLANSALALQYRKQIHWKSPTYTKTEPVMEETGEPSVIVEFQDVTSNGLYLLETAYNALDKNLKCSDQPPGTCAGAAVLLNGKGWVNATVTIKDTNSVVLTATNGDAKDVIVATSYGWGSIPMMTIYDKGTDLPVLPWNEKM